MIWIDEYHKILRKYSLKEKEGHLLLPEKFTFSEKTKLKLIKSIFIALGDTRAEDKNFRLLKKKHLCTFTNCVSPQCYDFTLNMKILDSNLDNDDIIEIAKSIDHQRLEVLGFKKYLEEYNKGQPDIFKLSAPDFKIVLNYMKGNK